MKNALIILILLFAANPLQSQIDRPTDPGKAVILYNGTAHLGNGSVMEHCALGIENGKIIFVADARTIRIDTSRALVIDVSGKHIYPGFIACNTTLGLTEIDAVRATRDFAEVGDLNPEVRALIAFNTDSKILPTMTANGILTAQIVPRSGRISGLSSVVKLSAWNWEDATISADNGLHLHWPEMRSYKDKSEWSVEINRLHQLFREAQAYAATSESDPINQKLEALRPLFNYGRKLYVHVQDAPSILHALQFLKQYDVQGVLVGAQDAWMVTDQLRKSGVPVILHPVHSLPAYKDQAVDQPYRTPGLLEKDSILFTLSGYGSWKQRTLHQQAGTAVAYGLDYEKAVQAITLNAARILGVDDVIGTLEAGKDATLFVSEGDALDIRTSTVEYAFIQGRLVNLDNHQYQLYELYRRHYGLD